MMEMVTRLDLAKLREAIMLRMIKLFQVGQDFGEGWSSWIDFRLRDDATIDLTKLYKIRRTSGVYAIGYKRRALMEVAYVGRTKNSMRDRVKSHLTIKIERSDVYEEHHQVVDEVKYRQGSVKSRGSKGIRDIIAAKYDTPSMPFDGFYVTFLPTKAHKIVESLYIKDLDPLANIQGALDLPPGLTHEDILKSDLENDQGWL
jgi:hypothetical protein